jgi:hypothetical protein
MAQTTLEDRIDLYRTWYRKWNIDPFKNVIDVSFDGCSQWQFTDLDLFDINRYKLEDKTFGIIINHELIPQLILKGVKAEQITFFSDCNWRTAIAQQEGVNVIQLPTIDNKKETKKNIKRYTKEIKDMKKFNYVLNNVPFGLLKEFKALSETLASEKALIISGSRDFQDTDNFQNVEFYQYLGRCFPTAKIEASVLHVNPNGASSLIIRDQHGVEHKTSPNPLVPPGKDFDVWNFAESVVSQKLKSYTDVSKGKLARQDAIVNSAGVPVVFSGGKAGEEFDSSNEALNTESLARQSTKYCWAKISNYQQDIVGIGVHKVIITNIGPNVGHLGHPKYLDPTWGCANGAWMIPCQDKVEAEAIIKYLTHPDVVKLVKGLKAGVLSNSKRVFEKIPHHSQASKWIKNYGS